MASPLRPPASPSFVVLDQSPQHKPDPGAPSDWWDSTIQIKVIDLIYALTRGSDSNLVDLPVERLLSDRSLDQAIRSAWEHKKQHSHAASPEQADSDDHQPSEDEWNADKRKILECLRPLHREREAREPRQWKATNSDAPDSRLPEDVYHTPRTPAAVTAKQEAREQSESRTSVRSDRTATFDAPQNRIEPEAASPFSPQDYAVTGSRRRRSSSSMQNEKPGKRARGPQEHICHVCRKKFPFLSKLNDHLKTHSADKNLRCHLCRKSFKRTREVNAHLKSVHKVDTLQLPSGPSTPSTPAPTLHNPPTPITLPPPTPAASHPYYSSNPGSATLPPPPPPPRRQIITFNAGVYGTPGPTPESFGAPTPSEHDAETPRGYTLHDEKRYSKESDDVEALGALDKDFNNLKLPPLLNLSKPSGILPQIPSIVDPKVPSPKQPVAEAVQDEPAARSDDAPSPDPMPIDTPEPPASEAKAGEEVVVTEKVSPVVNGSPEKGSPEVNGSSGKGSSDKGSPVAKGSPLMIEVDDRSVSPRLAALDKQVENSLFRN